MLSVSALSGCWAAWKGDHLPSQCLVLIPSRQVRKSFLQSNWNLPFFFCLVQCLSRLLPPQWSDYAAEKHIEIIICILVSFLLSVGFLLFSWGEDEGSCRLWGCQAKSRGCQAPKDIPQLGLLFAEVGL